MFGQGLDVKKTYIVMLICFPVNKELSLPLSLPLYVRLCLSLCLSVSVSLSLSHSSTPYRAIYGEFYVLL